ncbi:hypothetical protein LOTGIDRAFT_228266 [Lottia gigantea]|uniref:Prolyl 4-hydroxylase alpha subunit domain-containing protein n=1 Tax=Lottia gigantea TaxID=225164 RepID=V4A1E4_LOTGI|nr:hypothetical protein LOTGIDRAFT_228266 [Lottia gigantea]ESO97643.1 hypothetical protein LOTGIDRAFT_228266 [Lottia gigantea]
MMYKFYTLLLVLFGLNGVYGHVFTSSAKFRQFLEQRENITEKIGEYIEYERERLIVLNKSTGYEDDIEYAKIRIEDLTQLLSEVKKNKTESKEDSIDEIIHNPVKAYVIIKHFVANYRTKFSNQTKYGYKYHRVLDCPQFNSPTIIEQRDALDAILRIQTIHELSADDIMNGRFMGRNSPKLTAADAYIFGATAHNENLIDIANDWISIAWERLNGDVTKATFNWKDALRRLILLKHSRHEKEKTSELLNIGVKKDTGNIFHKMYLAHRGDRLPYHVDYSPWPIWSIKRRLCNQKHIQPMQNTTNLRCKYRSAMSRPIYSMYREEVINNKPYISIIHGFLTDTEVDSLIQTASLNLTLPKEQRNTYFEVASLDVDDDTSRLVSSKISNMFRYNLKSSNMPKLINYGLGGYLEEEYKVQGVLNALASLTIFLSDIEESGRTIFTKLGISVPSQKGNLLYWFNKEANDHDQLQKQKYSCPVVFGEKWDLTTSIKVTDYVKICKRRRKTKRI